MPIDSTDIHGQRLPERPNLAQLFNSTLIDVAYEQLNETHGGAINRDVLNDPFNNAKRELREFELLRRIGPREQALYLTQVMTMLTTLAATHLEETEELQAALAALAKRTAGDGEHGSAELQLDTDISAQTEYNALVTATMLVDELGSHYHPSPDELAALDLVGKLRSVLELIVDHLGVTASVELQLPIKHAKVARETAVQLAEICLQAMLAALRHNHPGELATLDVGDTLADIAAMTRRSHVTEDLFGLIEQA